MGTHLNRTVTSSEDEQLQESAEGDDEGDEEIKTEEKKFYSDVEIKKYLSEIKPFGKWTKNITYIDKLVKSVDEEFGILNILYRCIGNNSYGGKGRESKS